MSYTFSDDVAPDINRGGPNPFTDAIKNLIDAKTADGKQKAAKFDAGKILDAKAQKTLARKIQVNGTGLGVTVRVHFTSDAKTTTVRFWPTPRTARKPAAPKA
jgi:hypothetical protein